MSTEELAALSTELESDHWNSSKALAALYTHKHERAAVQAICNAMHKLTDSDLLDTLMQFVHLIVIFDFPELETLLMDRCHSSMQFALRTFFLLQAAMEDDIPELDFKTNRLWKQCELAAINAESHSPPRNRVCVHNGTFTRRSQGDCASPSPRFTRSMASLPTVPAHHNSHRGSLSSSTSIIHHEATMSPPTTSTQTEVTEATEATEESANNFEINPDTLAPNDGPFELKQEGSESSLCNSSDSITSSTLDPAAAAAGAAIQPSYASASATPSNTHQEIQEQPDKSLYFKLRHLSGEGQSDKQHVYEYFYTELHMINSLFNISTALMSISLDDIQKLKEVRGRALRLLLVQINTQLIQSEQQSILPHTECIHQIDESLTYGVEIPLVPGWVIVKIHPEDSFCLSSRNRVPYMMLIEVLSFDVDTDSLSISNLPQHQTRAQLDKQDKGNGIAGEDDWVILSDDSPHDSTVKKGFIELWNEKEKRIRDSSPFSHLPGWRLSGVIVKSGDDLRQEQLASQIIFKIHSWFQAEKLPLYLRPYVVLATSSTTGLIECIPDTCSIDSLKKRIPNFGSLSNYFICSYGHRTSNKFLVAQTNFVESLAAYSIVCYLLQIKDRHNGNILLDVEGHVIHIDFGFMLSISPGNLGFELAPFKLNREMVDLIGGPNSDMFKYFKTLLLSGLLEVRRHSQELLLLVEVMAGHSRMACYSRGGAQVLAGFRERLALDKNDEQCLQLVDTLVYNAMRSWTTQHYDSYQYYTNGIL